jgi:LCP family protein required for cell wall assembly
MSNQKPKYKIIWPQFLLRLFLIFLLGILIWGGFFLKRIYSFEKNNLEFSSQETSSLISTAKEIITKDKKALRGENRDRINILLLGMGGEGHSGQYLTDTIILASINPTNYETSLVSIPRDLYVEIPDSKIYTKINAVYAYGKKNLENENLDALNPLKKTVEKITGQTVDYHLMLDFEGFKKVIDELNGIIIQVDNDIIDHRYPGPGRSYETFEIKKGTHLINGDTALKYARVRHTPGGDFARLERQQDIISASKRRALSIENFINPIKLSNLLEILEENIQTNIKIDEIPAFIELFKNINTYEMNAKVLDAWSPDSLLAVSHVLLGNINAFILVPRTGNYQEIQNLADNIFNLNKIEKEKEAIEKESARILVVSDQYQNSPRVKTFFQKMGYSVEIEENSEIYQNCQQNIKIFTPENSEEIYTLNDLTRKFQADIESDLSFDYSEEEIDLILCFPEKEIKKIEKQIDQNSADDFEEKSILDNDGNIMYNEN